MAEQFIKSARRTGTSLGISIPKEIVELLGIGEGDFVRISIEKVKKNAR
ncbi:TPA: AbrB/MazE/SpoVT family DNA-binding domain-containing protein [Candidatus Woesearchaeota archaeon]|nr:AbrB/MazE/SpoVT family DNA-binding domain-containing protein [Candidatus Woesearchaeota archaeon]HIH91753.1 AbrB/MazE/SpoVT family DNA-binding domain-containing protein [Candidatus Woesearchaeota archaeon]HII65103.1 AbrB/MazE/SpoVT family DNA-binding domain-containing protein [Candidatus Woesearchaeota archaeon]HII65927.1 AbrB/MazE/SpoVT family DNA-binding domain-containing protein [Candidatus Woesearchaeota archaeon]HIJ19098.1 AbrB/MazE/SpoVT family DNA-binding domain-containing protein [Ca